MTIEQEATVLNIPGVDIQEKTDRTELFNQTVNCVGENHISSLINDLHIFEGLRVKEAYENLSKEEYSLLEKLSLIELKDSLDEIEDKEEPCIQVLYFFRLITYGNVRIRDIPKDFLEQLLGYIPQEMCKDGEMEEFEKHLESKNRVRNIFSL